jgi:hypothetical protein
MHLQSNDPTLTGDKVGPVFDVRADAALAVRVCSCLYSYHRLPMSQSTTTLLPSATGNLQLAYDNTIGYDICTAVLSLASVAHPRLLWSQ